jgi:hypothetical protein
MEQVLEDALAEAPCFLTDLIKKTGRSRVEVNQTLYAGAKKGLFRKIQESPPMWDLAADRARKAEKTEKPAGGNGVLVLLDTGGLPNLLLPLARMVVEDPTVTGIAPLDAATMPPGLRTSASADQRRIIARAEETGRLEILRPEKPFPKFADTMLAIKAGELVATRRFNTCVVAGHDSHSAALAAVLQQLGCAVETVKNDEEFAKIMG